MRKAKVRCLAVLSKGLEPEAVIVAEFRSTRERGKTARFVLLRSEERDALQRMSRAAGEPTRPSGSRDVPDPREPFLNYGKPAPAALPTRAFDAETGLGDGRDPFDNVASYWANAETLWVNAETYWPILRAARKAWVEACPTEGNLGAPSWTALTALRKVAIAFGGNDAETALRAREGWL